MMGKAQWRREFVKLTSKRKASTKKGREEGFFAFKNWRFGSTSKRWAKRSAAERFTTRPMSFC